MTEPFLIAHLVRGEPAFDIAIKLMIGDEEGWIIPTSGHRARPYWSIELSELRIDESWPGEPSFPHILSQVSSAPENWPDHYTINDRPPPAPAASKRSTEELMKDLGF